MYVAHIYKYLLLYMDLTLDNMYTKVETHFTSFSALLLLTLSLYLSVPLTISLAIHTYEIVANTTDTLYATYDREEENQSRVLLKWWVQSQTHILANKCLYFYSVSVKK